MFRDIAESRPHPGIPQVAIESGSQFCELLADQIGRRVAENHARGAVGIVDPVAAFHRDDPIGGGFRNDSVPFLGFQNTAAGSNPQAQLVQIHGLPQIVVGPGFQPGYQVGGIALAGEQDEVNVVRQISTPYPPAHLQTIRSGHDPVQNCKQGTASGVKLLPGRLSIAHDHNLVSPFAQDLPKHDLVDAIVFRQQDLHDSHGIYKGMPTADSQAPTSSRSSEFS